MNCPINQNLNTRIHCITKTTYITIMTIIEKIIAAHSKFQFVKPGDIADIVVDARVARDFGGANVVKHIEDNGLELEDVSKTFFTFDTNPTGSDQKYAANQQVIRFFARKHGIRIYDINSGIGTHTLISLSPRCASGESARNLQGLVTRLGSSCNGVPRNTHFCCWENSFDFQKQKLKSEIGCKIWAARH